MNRIEVVADCSTRQKECGIFSFLFFLSGVYGVLLFLGSMEGVFVCKWVIYPSIFLFCMGLWYAWIHGRNYFWTVATLSGICCLIVVFALRNVFKLQFQSILDCLYGKEPSEELSVTGIVLLFFVVLSLLLFVFEFEAGIHGIGFLLFTILLLASPLLDVKISKGNLFLILLFQMGFYAAKKRRCEVAIMLAICFIVAGLFISYHSKEFYAAAYQVEGFVYRSVQKLSGEGEKSAKDGVVSRGNTYRTGMKHLELVASSKPSEVLYLSGFTGGEYKGGTWVRSDDAVLFERMEEKLNWQQWGYMIYNLFEPMYFVMNQNMGFKEPAEPITLTINHVEEEDRTVYAPYYRRRDRGWGQNLYLNPGNSYAKDKEKGYTYLYFEKKDMHVDLDHRAKGLGEVESWYHEIRNAYIEEAKEAYTKVPIEKVPRYKKLVEEHPLKDQDEITSFILHTLHSNASYSMTPGWTPFREEIAEYFLFERKSGYCVHFATAATILYRLYGIPARYVSGYKVEPSDFTRTEDGQFHADVTDGEAHAWVEIFLKEYGWTPVEVTPAANESELLPYPEYEGKGIHWFFAGTRNVQGDQNSRNPKDETVQEESGRKADDFNVRPAMDFQSYRDVFLIIGVCLGYSVLLLPLFVDYRRLRKRRKMEEMTCRMIFARLLELLHGCGKLLEWDGSEPDFASQLSNLAPRLSEIEVFKFLESVRASSYGPKRVEHHEEIERALWVYRNVEKALRDSRHKN